MMSLELCKDRMNRHYSHDKLQIEIVCCAVEFQVWWRELYQELVDRTLPGSVSI